MALHPSTPPNGINDPLMDLLPDLAELDVMDAMRDIQGYLDISPGDFQELYHASASHALTRMAGNPMARALMRAEGPALVPEQPLSVAVAQLAAAGVKSAAVVDPQDRVIGLLSETDVLRHMGVDSILALLVRLGGEPEALKRCCAGVRVSDVMTSPALTLPADATLPAMARAFARHGGRGMPVVDGTGRLLGMLARKDLIHAYGAAGPHLRAD
ncbi:MAG: CBS domain-containing protein [Chromatiaceae bacterium]|nr:CBS domain-containing protein [Chromatiaceae bacterium]